MNNITYLYCRISRKQQSIERQIRNLTEAFPEGHVVKEVYTGTTIDRKEWNKLYSQVQKDVKQRKNVTIAFDSVSRFSRNAEEGMKLYEELFNLGVNLVFLKEPHINTDTYKSAINVDIQMTGTSADIILRAIKEYLITLAKEQVKISFDQSEKEVLDLRQRTKEGLITAKLNNKQIGRIRGYKYTTSKEKESKRIILKNSKDFNGYNNDKEVIKLCGITKVTYYKYKRELKLSNINNE